MAQTSPPCVRKAPCSRSSCNASQCSAQYHAPRSDLKRASLSQYSIGAACHRGEKFGGFLSAARPSPACAIPQSITHLQRCSAIDPLLLAFPVGKFQGVVDAFRRRGEPGDGAEARIPRIEKMGIEFAIAQKREKFVETRFIDNDFHSVKRSAARVVDLQNKNGALVLELRARCDRELFRIGIWRIAFSVAEKGQTHASAPRPRCRRSFS